MESFMGKLSQKGTTLYNDASSRLGERPNLSSQSSQGGLVKDLGSTDWITSSQSKKSSKVKGSTNKGAKCGNKASDVPSDDSDDGMDLFSIPSDDFYPSQSKVDEKAVEGIDYTVINGERHDFHPEYLPKGRLPSFKKLKATNSDAGTSKLDDAKKNENSSRPRPVSRARGRAQESTSPLNKSRKPDSARALRDRSPNQRVPPSPPQAPPPRPRPKPAYKGKNARIDSDSDSTRKKKKAAASFPVSPIVKDAESSFPMPSPLSSQVQRAPRKPAPFPLPPPSPKGKGKAKATRTHSLSSSDEDEDELAMTSYDDLQTRGKGNVRPFPMSTQVLQSIGQSPNGVSSSKKRLSDDGEKGREKKKRREEEDVRRVMHELSLSDHGGDSDEFVFLDPSIDPKTLCPYCDTLLPPTPTPLLLKLLATAKLASTPDARPTNPLGRKASMTVYVGVCQRHRFESVWLPKARQKRWKEVIDWEDTRRRVEGMKNDLRAILEDEGGEEEEGDSMESECRSDDEDDEMRREKNRAVYQNKKGPRKRCVFWNEIMKAIKSRGVRGVVGVRGQYDSFEKTQPGYYGEQGSVIIHQTLYTLFPPTSISPTQTHPLAPADFLQRILVPQVGLTLIQEDLDLSTKKALKTMRESTSYGVAMFPADEGGDGDGGEWAEGEGGKGDRLREERMGVADKIVLERARRRRKELEVEEREENEAFARQLAEQKEQERLETKDKTKRKANGGKNKGKRSGTATCSEVSEASSVEVVETFSSQPRKPVSKAQSLDGSQSTGTKGERPKPRPRTRPLSHANTEPQLSNPPATERPLPKRRTVMNLSVEPGYRESDLSPVRRQPSNSEDDFPGSRQKPARNPKPSTGALPPPPITEDLEECGPGRRATSQGNRSNKGVSIDVDMAKSDTLGESDSKRSVQSRSRGKAAKVVTTDDDEVEIVSPSQATPVKRDRKGKKVLHIEPDDDATPRPTGKGERGSSVVSVVSDTGSSTSRNFHPLHAARARKARERNGNPWSYRMSPPTGKDSDTEIKDAVSSDDTTRIHRFVSPRPKKGYKDAWLLSDRSYSSSEGD